MATQLDAWPETNYRWYTHDVFYIVIGPRGLKLGITSGDARRRLAEHRRNGYVQTVRLWTELPGRVADDTKDLVLARLKTAGHKPTQGHEYFNAELLPAVLGIADHELVWYTPRAVACTNEMLQFLST